MKNKTEGSRAHLWPRLWEQNFNETVSHIELLIHCALWGAEVLHLFEIKIRKGTDFNIPKFPDTKMRTFEQLGRELDEKFRRMNTLLPETKPKGGKNE